MTTFRVFIIAWCHMWCQQKQKERDKLEHEQPWICVRQRAGPLTKECRALRPRLSPYDSPEDRRDKAMILKPGYSALDRNSVDKLELLLALFGFEGTHYTLTYEDSYLPPDFDRVRNSWKAFRERLKRWHGGSFDYIACIEGRHGDHRYHIHLVLRYSDFSPAEVRWKWGKGEIDDEPVLRKEGGFRRLAKYFNKERPDGFIIPINKHPWSCNQALKRQLPQREEWFDSSGVIDIPDEVSWARRGSCQNDFGSYYYGSYILPKKGLLF